MRILDVYATVLIGTIFILSATNAGAANFGDEVSACAARSGLPPNSPGLDKVFTDCEKEASSARNQDAASKSDVSELIANFQKCLGFFSSELDDSISPASEIARAAAYSCRPQWQAVLLANKEPLSKMEAYPNTAVMEAAVNTVLNERKAKRSQKR